MYIKAGVLQALLSKKTTHAAALATRVQLQRNLRE